MLLPNQLVLYPNKIPFYNSSKLTKNQRDFIPLIKYHRSILIGLLLSDGWLQKRKGWNPRQGIKQSIKHFFYIWFLFNELGILCSNYPVVTKCHQKNKFFYSITCSTRQQKIFNQLNSLFYNEKQQKCIKQELFNYLDEIVLAHWIMGDGAKRNNGLTLCTDSFSLKEHILLINILYIKFNIICSLHKQKSYYRIYINKKELDKIKNIIRPYILIPFRYKIHD